MAPIPPLLIDHVDVDFQMGVIGISNIKSTTNAEVEAKVSAKHWFINTEISGKTMTVRENTRMINQMAEYQIHVTASQQPQTEGLSKPVDIVASRIESINTESSKQSTNIQNGMDKVPFKFDNNHYENIINVSSIQKQPYENLYMEFSRKFF